MSGKRKGEEEKMGGENKTGMGPRAGRTTKKQEGKGEKGGYLEQKTLVRENQNN